MLGYFNLKRLRDLLPFGETPPRLDAIQFMRMWVADIDSLEGERSHGRAVEIANVKFVGNRWEFNGIRDLADELLLAPPPGEEVTIGTINNKDDPKHYTPPYQPDQEEGIENREQSLLLAVENFAPQTSFQAVKRFFGKGQDYQQYRELQFFLRAENPIVDADSCSFYLQIAYDSLNYYEIEVPLEVANRWMWVKVNMSDLTNLKIDASDALTERPIRDVVDPDMIYTAKLLGSPTLFQVRYLFCGLRNKGSQTVSEGRIFFNDIKLGSVRRDIDHAERASVQASFGGVFSINGNWTRTGPEFRSLRQKSGSGVTTSNYSVAGRTEINRFIPTGGFRLPFSASYSTSKSLPKYVPKSDVEIAEEAVRDSLKSVGNVG